MKPRFAEDLRAWTLPLLSGALIGTSYIPFPPWASLFCWIPLWYFWQVQRSGWHVAAGGVITAFVFTLIGFNWVTYLLHEFAHLDWPLAVLGMIGFALIAHLYVPVAGLLWYWGQRRFQWPDYLSIPLLALITALCEANSVTLFDWNFGYSWYGAGLPIYHWAEVIGFSGLSAATILANLAMDKAWRQRSNRRGAIWLGGIAVSFVLLNVGGVWLKSRLPPPDMTARVALVQGNVGDLASMQARFGEDYQEAIIRRYFHLTDEAVNASGGDVDFVLWPETAFPVLLGKQFMSKPYPAILKSYLQDRRLALVTGAYSVDDASQRLTNSLFALDREGNIASPGYSKTILLAFGEYIPGEALFPWVRDFLPETGEFARGQGPTTLLHLNGHRMGPQICYESLFPAFTRSLANLGAQFIVNVTNDSWYGDWQEPYQHMYMTLARGVEFRRPVLRVTNTGISTVVLASGEILARSPIGQKWAGVYEVPYLANPPPTLYQTWYWLVPSMMWFSLATLLVKGSMRRAKNSA